MTVSLLPISWPQMLPYVLSLLGPFSSKKITFLSSIPCPMVARDIGFPSSVCHSHSYRYMYVRNQTKKCTTSDTKYINWYIYMTKWRTYVCNFRVFFLVCFSTQTKHYKHINIIHTKYSRNWETDVLYLIYSGNNFLI